MRTNKRKLLRLIFFSAVVITVLLKASRIEVPLFRHYSSWIYNQSTLKPHLLFIVADDLGFNDVGYHGSNISTPNIDALAMSGVRLENYYTQAVCTPTRSALLTGRYPIHTGIQRAFLPGQPIGMPLDNPTLADKLRDRGYSTHLIGKWHLGFHKRLYLPTNRGFDSFFGYLNGYSDYFDHISRHYNNTKGYDLFDNEDPANWSIYDGQYTTDLFADKTIDIIRNHNAKKPLFAYLNFQAVHSPNQAPEKYLKLSNGSNYSIRDIYEGMVRCMDDAVGRVVEAMKKKGLWDNSVLIFTTDNGGPQTTGASNWPLRGYKGSGLEGGVRAVGFVNSKLLSDNVIGSVFKGLLHVTDWFPTLFNLAGGDLNGTESLDGVDQWESIRYGTQSQRQEILHDILPGDRLGEPMKHDNLTLLILRRASVRLGEWKILKMFKGDRSAVDQLNDTKRTFLYNIEQDPAEGKELSKLYPKRVRDMLKRIQSYHKGMIPSPNPKEDIFADPRYRRGIWEPWND